MGERDFVVFADAATSMTKEDLEKYGILSVAGRAVIDGEDFLLEDGQEVDEIYWKIARAKQIETSCLSPGVIETLLEEALKQGLDVIYVGMPEGISAGAASSALVAIVELRKLYPDRRIEWIDSHCMSWGLGLLLMEVLEKEDTFEGVLKGIRRERDLIAHLFTFSDLRHAWLSGKVHALECFVGSALKVQPFLELIYDGKCRSGAKVLRVLKTTQKFRGAVRFKEGEVVRDAVADEIIERTTVDLALPDGRVMVTYGASDDARLRAERIARLLREALPEARVEIGRVCPLIGCHVGPTVVSVHFVSRFQDIPPC